MAGQPLLERVAHRPGHLGVAGVGRHQVGGEGGVALPIGHGEHHRPIDRGQRGERGLDLPELDSMAPDLHLIIGSAQVVDVPVGAEPDQITGAVHPGARFPRVGDEAFGGKPGPVQVTAAEARTADIQLPRDARGDRAQPAVQDAGPGIPNRPADGRGGALVGPRTERVDRVLGRAVQVVPQNAGGIPQPGPQPLTDRFAAEEHQRRRGRRVEQAGHGEMLGIGRRHVDHVDRVVPAVRHQPFGIPAELFVADVHMVALDQPEQLLPRHVERERHRVRDRQAAATGGRDHRLEDRGPVVVLHVRQAAVRRDDALRFPGRTRGVDHVRGMVQISGPADDRVGGVCRQVDLVERDDRAAQPLPDRTGGQNDRRVRVVEDVGQTFVGMVEFQR